MAFWHCPHCGTPQAEAARCWVCKRSSTTCGTCRHYRSAVAGGLGFCALDRRRIPLRGDEVKGCWEGVEAQPSPPAGPAAAVVAPPSGIGWAEVGPEVTPTDAAPPAPAQPAPRGLIDPPPVGLWGEIEP